MKPPYETGVGNKMSIVSFENSELGVTVMTFKDEDEKIWFKARDVAKALGYKKTLKMLLIDMSGTSTRQNSKNYKVPVKHGYLVRVVISNHVLSFYESLVCISWCFSQNYQPRDNFSDGFSKKFSHPLARLGPTQFQVR